MPRGRPVEPEKRALVLKLHAAGDGRNAIAEASGVSASSVTAIVAEAGRSFDRSATRVAVDARRVDLAAMRAELARGLLVDAAWFREQARLPGQRMTVKGALVDLSRPEAGDARNWMTSLGIAVQRSMELEKFDSDRGVGDAVSVLDSLSAALKTAADVLDA